MNTDALASLFRSVNQDTVNLIDSLSGLSALAELGNHADSEQNLYAEVLRVLLENQDIERAALLLHDNGYLNLVARAEWGTKHVVTRVKAEELGDFQVKAGEGHIGEALQKNKIINNGQSDLPSFFDLSLPDDSVSDEVIDLSMPKSSLMCIPLVSQGNTYGILCVHHARADFFTQKHEQFLRLFSRFFVQNLLNNRYMRDLESMVADRTAQLEAALTTARKLQRDFRDLSLIDEQTGLPNRRFFDVETQAAIARSMRYHRDLSCCLVEISNFREIATQRGLQTGDRLLETIADILKIQVREGDILAHFHHEQFIMCLPEVGIEGARQFACRILAVFQDAQKYSTELESMELNFGLSTLAADMSDDSAKVMKLLQVQADQALQQARQQSSGVIHISDLTDGGMNSQDHPNIA